MRLFRRKQDVVTDIPELERYYAQRRTRNGLGWLMALVTLVITAVVATGIFLAGRWVFDRLNEDSATPQTPAQTEQQPTVQAPTFDGGDFSQNNNDQPAAPSQQPAETPTPTPTAPQPTPQTTPRTGDTAPPLPRTGDGPEQ